MTNVLHDVGAPGGRYLNARLKNCAFPGVGENNKNGCVRAGDVETRQSLFDSIATL